MPEQTIIAQLCQRGGTAAEWAAVNPVLAKGEVGYETDTLRRKTGDESTPWNQLGYDDQDLVNRLNNKTNNATTAALSGRVTTLEQDLDTAEQDINRLENEVDALQTQIAQHEALFNGLGFSATEHQYNPEHPAFQGLTALPDAVRWLLTNWSKGGTVTPPTGTNGTYAHPSYGTYQVS